MAKFRIVIREQTTSEHEYFVEAETNAGARAKAMVDHNATESRLCIGLSTVTDIVSTKVVKEDK